MNAGQVLELLKHFESRNVTFIEPDGSWPTVWERARGARVWDADGNKYLDLTAAFGVAAAGHANPRVVKAGQRQMAKLPHAMGDVHPHALKAELARSLSRITFERWAGQMSKSQIPNPKSAVFFAARKSARSWPNQSRFAAGSTFLGRNSFRCSASFAMNMARCSSSTKFTRDSAGPENGLRANTAKRCRTSSVWARR